MKRLKWFWWHEPAGRRDVIATARGVTLSGRRVADDAWRVRDLLPSEVPYYGRIVYRSVAPKQ